MTKKTTEIIECDEIDIKLFSEAEQNAFYNCYSQQNSSDSSRSSRSAYMSVSLYSACNLRAYLGYERKS